MIKPNYNVPILSFGGFESRGADEEVTGCAALDAEPVYTVRHGFSIMIPSGVLMDKQHAVDGIIQSRINEWKQTPKAQYLYAHAVEPIAIRSEIREHANYSYDDMHIIELSIKIRERHYLEYILTFQ